MVLEKECDAPRLGFFGGSFDPPHIGHLQLAQMAIKNARLDKLIFCPAYHAPLRTSPPLFSSNHRLAMLHAICKTHKSMTVSSLEVDYGQVRYTYDTIHDIKKSFPNDRIFLILGADQFCKLSQWFKIELLAQIVHFLVFSRSQKMTPKPSLKNLNYTFMDNPLMDISSTEIRESIRAGNLPQNQLPEAAFSYLQTHTPNTILNQSL